MVDEPLTPSEEELERLGLYDPSAADARDRLLLIRYAVSRGASLEDVAQAPNLGELALDMTLRARGRSPCAKWPRRRVSTGPPRCA